MAAHNAWRINTTATQGGSTVKIAEIEFRIVAGGADQTVAGQAGTVANASSTDGAEGAGRDWAYDDLTATRWGSTTLPAWTEWDFTLFDSAKDIVEVAITADSTAFADAPEDFTIESSDGGGQTVALTVVGEAPWSAGETRLFAVAASPTGSTALTLQHVPVDPSGSSVLYLRHLPTLIGSTSLTLQHIPADPSGKTSLTIQHQLIATGKSSLSIVHRPNEALTGSVWTAIIMLDGADVSASITGLIEVEATAGAARLANFVMKPVAGAIDSQAWVKKPVTIDYLTYSGGVLQTQHRRFTGFVADAIYDPATRLTTFECSDLLQESFEGVERTFIDSVVGGYYSDVIFNETESGWEYAQQRLESQEYYYDKDAHGAGRKWSKTAGAADAAYTVASVIDDTLTLSLATARDVINAVEIEFNYRLPRKWQRELSFGWTFPQSFIEWLGQSQIRMPNKSMFLSALGSSWWVKNVSFSETPESGAFDGTNWINHPEYELILGANATIATRWNQDINEKYTLTVKSDASIAKFGEIKETARYSFDADEEESHEDDMKARAEAVVASASNGSAASSYDYKAPEAGSVDVGNGDFYLDGTTRTDFDNAIKTAIALARVDILESHHRNEIGCDVLLDPLLDIGQSIQVTTPEVTGLGVLTSLTESMNLDAGSAISSIGVSVYAPNVASQDDDAIAVPAAADVTPAEAAPTIELSNYVGGAKTVRDVSGGIDVVSYAATPADPSWRGLLTNYTATLGVPAAAEFYPFEFRIELPEVEAALRDSQEFAADSSIAVAIPQETLTINA